MKFAHIADCHIGGWKEPKLKELGMESFRRAISKCIELQVDFLLIAGDLFNTALPQIDMIKEVASELHRLKKSGIRCYIVPGSHDFSPSGKTMLDVLEKAGLCENVVKFNEGKLDFTIDKSGAKITGLLGRKGGLEKNDYQILDKSNLENEPGFKIFMFHTTIDEFKPAGLEDVEGQSIMSLPKNFDYYAGGHVHYVFEKQMDKGTLSFPGALFPNNFKELEEWKHGGMYVHDGTLSYVPIKIKEVVSFTIDANDKTPLEVTNDIKKQLENIEDKIVTIRVKGCLKSGKPSEIGWKEILDNNSYHTLKNTAKLTSNTFQEIEIKQGNVEEVEASIIKEHLPKMEISFLTEDQKEHFTLQLIDVLNKDKEEGEKVTDFEKRLLSEALCVLKVDQ